MEKDKNPNLNDEEIRLLLETSTNEEAHKLLKKIQKSSANVSDFDKKNQRNFHIDTNWKVQS